MNKNILIAVLVALIAAVAIWWFASDAKMEIKKDMNDQVLVNPEAQVDTTTDVSTVDASTTDVSTVDVSTETTIDGEEDIVEIGGDAEVVVEETEREEGRVDENGIRIAP